MTLYPLAAGQQGGCGVDPKSQCRKIPKKAEFLNIAEDDEEQEKASKAIFIYFFFAGVIRKVYITSMSCDIA